MSGFGLAWLPEPMVKTQIESGRLIPVLEDWAHNDEGYRLYDPEWS